MTKLTAILVTLLSFGLSGCWWVTTNSEGKTIRKDVTTLQSQIGSKEKSMDAEIAKLRQNNEDATKLLKRNSADLGADMEVVRKDIAGHNGDIAQLKNQLAELKGAFDAYKNANDKRIDALEQRIGQLESGKPSVNTSAEDLWKLAKTAFDAQRWTDAIDLYARLHTSFPSHALAADAIYFKGQCYSNLKEWDKAIAAYQMLNSKFPEGSLTDDGLYFAAIAAQQLKQCGEARAYISIIKNKHPKSNVMKQANDLDAILKKDAKNKAKCAA
jgi:TolA-binding protein